MFIVKGFSSVGAILISAIGIVMLIVTIWAMKNSQFTFDNYTFLGIFLVADFIIVGAGIIGICGAKRQNGCLLAVFSLFVLLFFCIFLGLGIFAEVSPKYLFDGDCKASQNNKYIQEAYNISAVSNLLCTSFCPCNLEQNTIDNGGYNAVDQALLNNPSLFVRASNGSINFQDCAIADINRTQYEQVYAILNAVQYSLDCAGWCDASPSLVYRFSDINRGKPKTTCYSTMKSYTEEYAKIVGFALIGTALFMALVCFCNACLCCAQKEKKFTERFVVQRGPGNYYTAA